MSRWTHVVGAIHIDTFEICNDIERYIKGKLKDAPQITGSEGSASIFVNKENGYCMFCNEGEFQSRAIITIQGDLRDKDGSTTKKEVEKFIDYIKKLNWYIRIFVVNIEDECSQDECFILKEKKIMSNEEVKEEVEKVPEEVEGVSKKVAEEVPEEVQAEEVEQKDEPKFLNIKKLKCNYTVYKRGRTNLKMPIAEKCKKCGKKFKDSDELYLGYIKNDETKQNYLICKKCAK